MQVQTRDSRLKPLGYVQLTSLAAAAGVAAASVPDGAKAALIQAETQPVRYRDDGVAPTASVGMIIPANGSVWYTGWRFDSTLLQFIETTASAKVNILFYG